MNLWAPRLMLDNSMVEFQGRIDSELFQGTVEHDLGGIDCAGLLGDVHGHCCTGGILVDTRESSGYSSQ